MYRVGRDELHAQYLAVIYASSFAIIVHHPCAKLGDQVMNDLVIVTKRISFAS